ncbi:F-box only protein 39-like isoform X1, partial [Biomphalaria pfeifferi]
TNKISDVVATAEVIRKRPETPMESEEEPASKQIKLSTNSVNNFRACAVRNVKRNTRGNWKQLPYVVLKKIYSLLPNKDRFNMSLTCRAWGDPLTTPSIWRSLKFKLDRIEDGRTEKFVKKVLPYSVRYLSIDCAEAKDAVIRERDSLAYLQALIRYFVEQKTDKLVSLRLANMSRIVVRLSKFSKHKDFIFTLRRFLEIQTQLNVLNLSCAGFTLETGTSMLTKVGRSCGSKIKKLIIDGLFAQEENKDRAAVVLLEPFRLFTEVTSLTLSYEYLCDDVLEAFVSYGQLEQLRIYVEDVSRLDRLTSESWQVLRDECPNLEVHFVLRNVFHHLKFKRIMLHGIPLVSLDWEFKKDLSDSDWDNQDVCLCMKYTAIHFHNTIRHITLTVEFCFFELRLVFLEIVKRCLKIETVSLNVPYDLWFKRILACGTLWACIEQPRTRLRELNYNGVNIHLVGSKLHMSIKRLLEITTVKKSPFHNLKGMISLGIRLPRVRR